MQRPVLKRAATVELLFREREVGEAASGVSRRWKEVFVGLRHRSQHPCDGLAVGKRVLSIVFGESCRKRDQAIASVDVGPLECTNLATALTSEEKQQEDLCE